MCILTLPTYMSLTYELWNILTCLDILKGKVNLKPNYCIHFLRLLAVICRSGSVLLYEGYLKRFRANKVTTNFVANSFLSSPSGL